MCLVCILQYLAADPFFSQCETNTELVNYRFPEKLFHVFLCIRLQSLHHEPNPAGTGPQASAAPLKRLSECTSQWKNNSKHIIQGVLYHLYNVYWHFLAAVCFANVMSHRIKWRAVPGKPHNLTGSGTELLGNPQENSQPELCQVISIQVLQAFQSMALVEEHLSKMSVTGDKRVLFVFKICFKSNGLLNLPKLHLTVLFFQINFFLRTKELDTPYNVE